MAKSAMVKVKITKDCEGPGDGFKKDQETMVSAGDAEILRRRGFAVIVADDEAPKTESKS